jgi:hypothetical protein
LKAGDPADDADTWVRAVTNSTHVRRGAVHHAQFKKWLSPPDDPQAGWKLEISGQLLSLVGNIVQEGERRVEYQRERLKAGGKSVPSVLQFCGVLYASAAKVRSLPELKCDVIYDPNPNDNAHANIVVFDKGADEILTVTATLLEKLIWVPKDQIGADQALSSS